MTFPISWGDKDKAEVIFTKSSIKKQWTQSSLLPVCTLTLENPSRSRKLVLTSLSNTSPRTSNSCLSVQGSEAVLGSLSGSIPALTQGPIPIRIREQ